MSERKRNVLASLLPLCACHAWPLPGCMSWQVHEYLNVQLRWLLACVGEGSRSVCCAAASCASCLSVGATCCHSSCAPCVMAIKRW
jgi:hypothetical protein